MNNSKETINKKSLKGVLDPADVLLVVSPVSGVTQPSLPLHLLQASCKEAGIKAEVLYSNLLYSDLIGAELHKSIICDEHLLLGERLFAKAAFDIPSVTISNSIDKFNDPSWAPNHAWYNKTKNKFSEIPEPNILFREWLKKIDLEYLESITTEWLKILSMQIIELSYPVVGCSTTLGGILPVVALLNSIKNADPNVITILGGNLCQGEMSEGIHSLKTGVDYVYSGDGVITFPLVVRDILKGHPPKERTIFARENINLDINPLPNYENYIKQRDTFPHHWPSEKKDFALPYESSRGCWYGKCTFCGLKGKGINYRLKSANKVIQDIKTLTKQHGLNEIYMNDTVMPFQYLNSLVPRLEKENSSIKIFYMASTKLSLNQVISLMKAGIREILVGIESLSPSLLKRMCKENSIKESISLLRYSRSIGIDIKWFILFGFPGDEVREYEEMIKLFPLFYHLTPPSQMWPLRLSRFSKYYLSPETYNISNLRPADIYEDTLPPFADIDKLAYFFTGDFDADSYKNPEIISKLWKHYNIWFNKWTIYQKFPLEILLPTLHITQKSSDEFILEDTRGLPGAPERREINREEAKLLLVSQSLETKPDINWVIDAGLGVVLDKWYIPLATAEPSLLQIFENEYEQTA